MRKKIIYKMCEIIKCNSNDQVSVNMVTNGTLVTEKVAEDLKNAGFSNIQVSLDGADAETHDWLRNKKGAFDNAINAITLLKKAGIRVGVACTPNLKNIEQLEDIVNLCDKLGVSRFVMQPLMPLGRAQKELDGCMPTYDDYRKIAINLQNMKYRNFAEGRIECEWGDPVDHLIRMRRNKKGLLHFVGVNAYGDITISPYLPLSVGNIRKYPLSMYWENGLSQAFKIPLVNDLAALIKSCCPNVNEYLSHVIMNI